MSANFDPKALFSLSYGLYLVTSHDGQRDNGMIANTACQQTDSPCRVSVTINKANYSHDVIRKTGKMNVHCLSKDTPFAVFERFGFHSGKDTDKFADAPVTRRSQNGLAVVEENVNAWLSLEVEQYIDLGTHGMFICSVPEAETLSSVPSLTYADYHRDVKPKRQPQPQAEKTVYVCRVCGYVYEGDPLPEDYVCPLCKHDASYFDKVTK